MSITPLIYGQTDLANGAFGFIRKFMRGPTRQTKVLNMARVFAQYSVRLWAERILMTMPCSNRSLKAPTASLDYGKSRSSMFHRRVSLEVFLGRGSLSLCLMEFAAIWPRMVFNR